MLVLTSKKFEFEETVKAEKIKDGMEEEYKKLVEEKNIEEANKLVETLYEFVMQITSDELKQIDDIIFNRQTMKLGSELAKKEVFSEEYETLEKDIEELAISNQNNFEDICFKEHKEPLRQAIGEYKYLEIVEMVFNFFWSAFIEKKTKQVNTMTSDLRKIGSN